MHCSVSAGMLAAAHLLHDLRVDRVVVELSPYDLTRGRIVYRYR